MALANSYVQITGQLAEIFKKISEGEAPSQFTIQHLKDLGYGSSNHRALIPLLKALGFLDANGKPTQRYHDYRNQALSKQIMGEALREAYGDIFVLKSRPNESDKNLVQGKFKSAHNVSEHLSKLMTNTFYTLLPLADLTNKVQSPSQQNNSADEREGGSDKDEKDKAASEHRHKTALHYNIQIHLPPTKDTEVYNAIFKSLKEHLLD